MITAKGHNGQLEVHEDKIIIKRKGVLSWMNHGFKGNKEIYINQISSIQFKNAGLMTSGYIQFAFLGGREAKGGLFQGATDENTIMFVKNKQEEFVRAKEEIERLISQNKKGNTNTSSDADEIKKFANMRDDGIITEEEFQKKKSQILGL